MKDFGTNSFPLVVLYLTSWKYQVLTITIMIIYLWPFNTSKRHSPRRLCGIFHQTYFLAYGLEPRGTREYGRLLWSRVTSESRDTLRFLRKVWLNARKRAFAIYLRSFDRDAWILSILFIRAAGWERNIQQKVILSFFVSLSRPPFTHTHPAIILSSTIETT